MSDQTPVIVGDRLVAVDPHDLTLHPDNPRRGDVAEIADSIRQNGFVDPVIVQQSTGYIIGGNHRVLAARMLGMDAVPVVYVDVDDTVAHRLLIALNRSSDLASWDDAVLARILTDLAADDALDGSLYTTSDLDALLAALDPGTPDDPDDGPPDSGGGRASTDVTVQIGTWTFTVDRDVFVVWEQDVVALVGARNEDVAAEVRGRLGL